ELTARLGLRRQRVSSQSFGKGQAASLCGERRRPHLRFQLRRGHARPAHQQLQEQPGAGVRSVHGTHPAPGHAGDGHLGAGVGDEETRKIKTRDNRENRGRGFFFVTKPNSLAYSISPTGNVLPRIIGAPHFLRFSGLSRTFRKSRLSPSDNKSWKILTATLPGDPAYLRPQGPRYLPGLSELR